MYLKMVGCLGIVAATSGYGYSRGMEYQRQITDTGELQRVIRQLAGEMEYTYAPLAQVCASVSRRCSQNYRIWLEHLAKELEKMPAGKKQSKEKICPECGLPMKKRNGRFGEFWGCTGYPDCRHTENT